MQGYTAANDAETIWVKRSNDRVLINALHAGDFLHFTNCSVLYQDFQKHFQQKFDVQTGSVGFYLGNRIMGHTDPRCKLTVEVNQSEYVDELLARFDMTDCKPVSTSGSASYGTIGFFFPLGCRSRHLSQHGGQHRISCLSVPS